jgi:sulfur carrier protein ThiS
VKPQCKVILEDGIGRPTTLAVVIRRLHSNPARWANERNGDFSTRTRRAQKIARLRLAALPKLSKSVTATIDSMPLIYRLL